MKYDPKDGPPTLLLTGWAIDLAQRLEGVREPNALFGKQHQRSVSRLIKSHTPTTPHNLNMSSLPSLPPADVAKLKGWRLDELRTRGKHSKAYDEPLEATAARLERSSPAPYHVASAFFSYLPDQTETSLTLTRQMADR
jgi:hypothetical protein